MKLRPKSSVLGTYSALSSPTNALIENYVFYIDVLGHIGIRALFIPQLVCLAHCSVAVITMFVSHTQYMKLQIFIIIFITILYYTT